MRNSLGEQVIFTLFGESHGPYIGGTLDNLPAGLVVDEERIKRALARRRPDGKSSTARVERDAFQIISGVYKGRTTGEPLTLIIQNENVHSGDYPEGLVRPGHADYVAHELSGGYNDPRGGGHFSGRLTAAIVALGEICRMALETKGVAVMTHIYRIGDIYDQTIDNLEENGKTLQNSNFPVLSKEKGEAMLALIEAAKAERDSIGGVTETIISGLPLGLGNPWFGSLEGVLSNAMFGLGGVKGIEFGEGFNFASMKGSEANDGYQYKDGEVVLLSNHNGGINGGISNGEPVVFRLAIKPISSIAKAQPSINTASHENVILELKGRHDPCIVHRICSAVDGLTSIVLLDEFMKAFGKIYFCVK